MIEIFKNSKGINARLLEKIVFFESYRKKYFENHDLMTIKIEFNPEKLTNAFGEKLSKSDRSNFSYQISLVNRKPS